VSRTGYPNLFAMIGTQYGAGNGSTTFNVPYLIDRTVWGGTSNVGAYLQPGLPNIAGNVTQYGGDGRQQMYCEPVSTDGAFWQETKNARAAGDASNWIGDMTAAVHFDASRSNPIYGRSGTVQPPALVLLPCIHI
jgi:hypothetical protein